MNGPLSHFPGFWKVIPRQWGRIDGCSKGTGKTRSHKVRNTSSSTTIYMNAASDALRKRFATLFRMWSAQLLSLRVCPIHWWEFPERLASSCHLVQPCRTSSDIPDPLGAQVSMGKRPPPAFWGRRCGVSVVTAMEPEFRPICRRRLSANRLLGRFSNAPGVHLSFGVSRNQGPSMAKLS